MNTLWKKQGVRVNPVIQRFCAGDDPVLDLELAWTDVYGSAAHARMLASISILSTTELNRILRALRVFLRKLEHQKVTITVQDEDIHTVLEHALTRSCGATGKKIHTGRSRNDQSLTNIRLYTKRELYHVARVVIECAQTLISFAQKYEWTPMPGYTHFRKAMPASVGLWASSFASLLMNDLAMLEAAYQLNDQSPLGSAASYGVPLPLKREMTAKLLGFSSVQNNVLACQNSRAKFAASATHALSQIMATLNRLATDLILFTSEALPFFILDPSVCTGSSIMPQKTNPDPLELIRGKAHRVLGHYSHIAHTELSIPSGYNRDLQEIKKPLVESFSITRQSCAVMNLIITTLRVNEKALLDEMSPELFATSQAIQLVAQGSSFRDAYHTVAASLQSLETPRNIKHALKLSCHSGGTGNLQLGTLKRESAALLRHWNKRQQKMHTTLQKLLYGRVTH